MTEILCRWLNTELGVSQHVDDNNFAEVCGNGYLIGEVLQKYQLQDDFEFFSQSKTSDSKLNNFTRLEPTFRLLEVPFDTNVARDIMTQKAGVATRLMYQLYIALQNKESANLTGVAMETMRPRAPVKLESMERVPYRERLKVLTPRQTDLNLDQLVDKFRERKRSHLDVEFKTKYEEEERRRLWQQEQRMKELEKAARARQRQTELVARIKAATVEIPKPPPNRTLRAIAVRKELARKREADNTSKEIAAFEQQISRSVPVGVETQDEPDVDAEVAAYLQQPEKTPVDQASLIKPASNDDYIGKIRKRLEEDAVARQEREKRRRKVLVDQLKAHEANEEMRREEFLVGRLMRQSQQERRIATQLLQLRHEKAVIQQNRIFRQQQYEERRQRDFQEALDKEAEMARQAKLEYIEQTQRDKELHDRIAQERAEARYQRHFDHCKSILMDIVDFSCKVGKYRELTNRLLPPKLMREWTLLFTSGQPLYEQVEEEEFVEPEVLTEEHVMEEERQKLLDEGDFLEYKNMVGEWQPPEDSEIKGIPSNNAILGHILARLFNIVSPPTPPPAPPEMPPFPVKACFLGKAFCGKTTLAEAMAQEHGLKVLNMDALVQEAVDAYKGGEIAELPEIAVDGTTVTEGGEADLQTETQTGVNISTTVTPAPSTAVDAKTAATPKTPMTVKSSSVDPDPSREPSRDPSHGAALEEGKEKGDEEKPEPPKDETGGGESKEGEAVEGDPKQAKKKKKQKPELSARGKLGQKAIKLLRKGQPLKDDLLIDIMVEAVKRAKEEQGWIMDGFPTTVSQAKLLEKALSGYDANAKPSKNKLRQSRLAPDPNPPKDPPPPVSGIDVVVLLEVQDELAMRRAAGRSFAAQAEEEFHQEFKPPPEGSATGVGKQEKVQQVKDPAFDQEQVQHRITGFQDAWKKMEKWFTGFHILQKLDVAMERDNAFQAIERLMIETKEKIEKAKEDASKAEDEEASKAAEPVPPTTADSSSAMPTEGLESTAPQPAEAAQPTPSETSKSAPPASPKGSRAGSAKGRGSSRGRSPKGEKGKRSSSKGSRSGSAKKSPGGSPKRKGSRSKSPKKRRTPTPEPEPEPEPPKEPPGPPPPQPGSEDWVYVDEPIDENLAHALAPHWDNTEATYLGSSKHVFRNIRHEREDIYHYFYRIRRNFESYLRRPDGKQEFVSMWQQEYNEIAEDMRDDDETKAELHQRVQDLKEQLWEMSDERKLEAESERQSVINEGWLEDRLGLLTNHYLTLMQCEVDRYQDSLRLLKDYYMGMEGKIPEELDPGFARIPLIDLPPMERPGSGIPPAESAAPSESHTQVVTPTPTTPSAKGKKGKGEVVEEVKEPEDEVKPKIPLVPRRPTSSEGFFPIPTPAGDKPGGAKGTKSRAGKGKEKEKPAPSTSADEAQESPQPPSDPDERLIFEAYQFGLHKISEMDYHIEFEIQATVSELAAKEAEEEADRAREAEKAEKAAEKKAGKGKDKDKGGKRAKSKSPTGKKTPGGKKSPKKGKKAATPTPPPTPPPVEDTPEEKARKNLKDRMKMEYVAAISHEEGSLKTRMELIKIHAIQVLQELKAKAEEAYKDMNDWLGARFIQEMDSINVVCQYFGEAIEKRQKVQPELVVFQDDFAINKLVKVYRTPSPPPRPDPMELAVADTFTVEQIINLQAQFVKSAPSGFISAKGFIDTLCDLTALTHGMEALPDGWMNVSISQLETLAGQLSPDSEYIDWRTFLLQACHPWPQPSQAQLLATLEEFRKADVLGTGTLTREQFEQVPLWYSNDQPPMTPEDPSEPRPFNRISHIQRLYFDIFADTSQVPPVLDYSNMLLYFSIDHEALNGFFRALSVASGKHMPRPKPLDPNHTKAELETMKEVVETMTGEDLIMGTGPIEQSLGRPEEGILPVALTATVPLAALVQVLHHGQPSLGDSHRFSVTSDPEDTFSQERLAAVYRELGSEELEPVPFFTLIEHPIIQDCLSLCHRYKAPDFSLVFTAPVILPSDNDAHSIMS